LDHLFLSHSTADDGFVRELREALADFGLEVWIDSRQLKGGDPLWSEVAAAIESAVGLVVLVSPNSLQSRWVGRELRHGLEVQAQRGRAAFPVIPLSLNATKLGVLEDDFTEEPAYIPVSSGAGGATAAVHDILVALGRRLPTDRPPVAQPRPEPEEELILKLSDLHFHEQEGVRRPAGNAQLFYETSSGIGSVESDRWRLIAPLGPIEAEELGWYLERWPIWPNPVLADRARKVEANLITWGQALHDAALPLEHTAKVLQGWAGVGEGASRRFSVTVDASLVSGASKEEEQNAAQEAATALLGLPWELLHNGKGFLFQGARPVRVRRRLPIKDHLPIPVVAPPIRVLLITARPEDEACGYIDHRASSLPLVAATEELGDLLRLTQLHPPTYPALEAELARAQQAGEPYHVVHFNGHGIYDRHVGLGGLCFEDPNDTQKFTRRGHQTVLTDRLGPLLTDYRIPLVFLEACQSAKAEQGGESVASELLQRGVVSVVAMSHSVLVETARRFVAAFYGELAKGQRVGQAMLAGQRALHSDQSRGQRYGIGELTLADWFVPVLYQEKQDPQLFEATPAPQTREDIRERLRARLGAVPPEPVDTGFVGRSRDLLALERLLRQERWAVLRGQGGEGKTALASELARWLVRSQQVRRAAFVSVELCSHEGAVLDALGRQLVDANYSTAKFENTDQALLPIERALKEQPTLVVIDNMESVLLPPYLDAPELLSEEAADELAAILKLAERLLRAGDTRIVFTSREALPAPFVANRQLRELHQLERRDAVALIERALAAGDGETRGERTLEARREAIEELAEAVQCHARTLALLGPELRRRGVEATREALVELMEEMEQRFPENREKSLYASVELSLRRLSPINQDRSRVLGLFHGGVEINVLMRMMRWEESEVMCLANDLIDTGLATPNYHSHLALNPSLCPYLKTRLSTEKREELSVQWNMAMTSHLKYLSDYYQQDPRLVSTLILVDLPNLMALLDQTLAISTPEVTISIANRLFILLAQMGNKSSLLQRVGRIRDAAASNLDQGWSHARFAADQARVEQQLQALQLQNALNSGEELLQQALAVGEQAYAGADYDIAIAFWMLGRVLQSSGRAMQALSHFEKAKEYFEAILQRRSGEGDQDKTIKAAESMGTACLNEIGHCLLDLGRYDDASDAVEEALRRDELRGDLSDIAISNVQLGDVRFHQERYDDAMSALRKALEIYINFNMDVSPLWFKIGSIYYKIGQPDAAEESYNKALFLEVQNGDRRAQAGILNMLGNLYKENYQRPEDAARFYQRSADLYEEIGDYWGVGREYNNLAETFRLLHRLDEARNAIIKTINCDKEFGHTALPWTAWIILSKIEFDAGNIDAALEARNKAKSAYLLYRRNGGENTDPSGQLVLAVQQAFESNTLPDAVFLLQHIAEDPSLEAMLPFVRTIQKILGGSRNRSLADNPNLSYDEAAEVLLLIESVENLQIKIESKSS
jgi:tetratricopeptide (TPR) repeat protein